MYLLWSHRDALPCTAYIEKREITHQLVWSWSSLGQDRNFLDLEIGISCKEDGATNQGTVSRALKSRWLILGKDFWADLRQKGY